MRKGEIEIFNRLKSKISDYRERKSQPWSKKRRIAVGAMLAAMLLYLIISFAAMGDSGTQSGLIKEFNLQINSLDLVILFGGIGVIAARKIYLWVKEKRRK